MIWLTWRQHRRQALYTAVALVALAAIMLPTGLSMHHSFTGTGLASCMASLGTAQITSGTARVSSDCQALSQQFSNQYNSLTFVGILFVILPVFVGIFLGAPLVAREVEHGTHRFVWTQGVSRRHWALVKFALLGAVTLVLAAAYALGMSWWFGPLVTNGGGRLGPVSFDVQGVVPIGYTLFAVSLGIFAGSVSRKVLPAMGVTLVGYAAVRVLIETFARPSYLSPLTATIPVTGDQQFNSASGAWIYAQGVVNGDGKLVLPGGAVNCGPNLKGNATASGVPSGTNPCGNGLVNQGFGPAPFSNWMRYQPGSRFWAFQGIETGIFLALTAILLYLAIRRIRRIA